MPPLLAVTRPTQWIKSAFVLAPLFFSGHYFDLSAWVIILTAALAFQLIAISGYILNDWHDRARDRTHPAKSRRPTARGIISRPIATGLAFGTLSIGSVLLAMLPLHCFWIMLGYALLNLAYTFSLKRIAILDVHILAMFYVLRVLMGCAAINVTPSPWILLSTFMLSLTLALGKRYAEINQDSYAKTLPSAEGYSPALIDRLLVLCAGVTLTSYALYTVEMSRQHSIVLVTTVFFVALGLMRYLQLVYNKSYADEPERLLVTDLYLQSIIAIWFVISLLGLST